MAEAWGGTLLSAYSLAGRLGIPFFPLYLRWRASTGREDAARFTERHGHPSAPRPAGPLIWVHAASVGETVAATSLVRRLMAAGHFVVLTTVTVTGARTAARIGGDRLVHQYSPLDVRPWVDRFLRYWRPSLAIFVESEVWPVTTDQLVVRRIPHVIVNARMSQHSFERWNSLGGASRRIFGRISLALAQTDADAARMSELGLRRVETLGNLKFDTPPPDAPPEALGALRTALGDRPVWLAASTHPGEEDIAAQAHDRLRATHPRLLTIIVPRHPERGAALAEQLRSGGRLVSVRSRGEPLPGADGILLADTLGELGLFYRLAPVSFVGGSLVPRGGQNPIEPVRLGSAVVHGPDTPNFASVYGALDAGGGAVIVRDAGALAAAVGHLLAEPEERRLQGEAAERALRPFSGALDRTLAVLAPFLAAGETPPW
ncbi:MAG: 3-deoxy-D-manno-octulosonic acid transferase [Bauldia sp.]|nr:3-deoxy-D-manno-octulosonic acid transferase [Bauldia sp.]